MIIAAPVEDNVTPGGRWEEDWNTKLDKVWKKNYKYHLHFMLLKIKMLLLKFVP